MDLINAQLPENKRFTLAQFECLASADIHLLTSAEQEKIAETHAQILRTTADLASSAQSATELATLQRLADFPARAAVRAQLFECRAQRMEIDRNKEQRAQAKAQREAEMHTHKITLELRKEAHKAQMDLRKFEHKLDMDTFHQHIVTERLDLQKKSLALREKRAASHPSHPGNLVKNVEDNSDRPKIRILVDEDGVPFTRFPTPNPLPDEVVIKNRAYTKKLLAGLVDPITGEELDEPNASRPCNADKLSARLPAAITPTDAAPAGPHSESNPGNPVNPVQNPQQKSQTSNPESPSEFPLETRNPILEAPLETPYSPRSGLSTRACNAQAPNRTDVDSGLSTQDSALSSAVHAYNIRRAQEYWTWRRHIEALPNGEPHPDFITQHRHCPCGQGAPGTPCPDHENDTCGQFPDWFWTISPYLSAYARCLTARNLPFRSPNECIPKEFLL